MRNVRLTATGIALAFGCTGGLHDLTGRFENDSGLSIVVTQQSCVDNDRDGFGPGCDLGPDCDDSNRHVRPNALEVCNGVDDDCDFEVDEGFSVGDECDLLAATCSLVGVTECTSEGFAICVAGPRTPVEICNGLDDDCDGEVDEDDPGGGAACDTGELGRAAKGCSSASTASSSATRWSSSRRSRSATGSTTIATGRSTRRATADR